MTGPYARAVWFRVVPCVDVRNESNRIEFACGVGGKMIRVEIAGETSIDTAPYYLLFGTCMLEEITRAESLMHSDGPSAGGGGGSGSGSGSGDAKSKVDTADDLQVCWENLELARLIYSKAEPTKSNELNLAEVFSQLAAHSLETENFQSSYDDYSKALELQQKVLTS